MDFMKVIVLVFIALMVLAGVTTVTKTMQRTSDLWDYCQERFDENVQTSKASTGWEVDTCVYENEEGKIEYVKLVYINGWKEEA